MDSKNLKEEYLSEEKTKEFANKICLCYSDKYDGDIPDFSKYPIFVRNEIIVLLLKLNLFSEYMIEFFFQDVQSNEDDYLEENYKDIVKSFSRLIELDQHINRIWIYRNYMFFPKVFINIITIDSEYYQKFLEIDKFWVLQTCIENKLYQQLEFINENFNYTFNFFKKELASVYRKLMNFEDHHSPDFISTLKVFLKILHPHDI